MSIATSTKDRLKILLLIVVHLLVQCYASVHMSANDFDQRTFIIENDQFMIDGRPIVLRAGEVHYSRIPQDLWRDRLLRLRAMGLNAISVYVFWNFHEIDYNYFSFQDDKDVVSFLRLAWDVGLLVLLRPGPYGCGEWDVGGLPSYLLATKPDKSVRHPIHIRTYDPFFIERVERWWSKLLPLIRPLLYENGGPVIMMQIENEYGSFGDVRKNKLDRQYMEHLVYLARLHLGQQIVLYTVDGACDDELSKGSIEGIYAAVNFGPEDDHNNAFAIQRKWNVKGSSPLFCSEFYPGWITHWKDKEHANKPTRVVAEALEKLMQLNASVSLYMAHGGTNFGFTSGANIIANDNIYQPDITSYDYSAPLSESGLHGVGSDKLDKFDAIRGIFAKYSEKPIPPEPEAFYPVAYGPIGMKRVGPILDETIMDILSSGCVHTVGSVKTMEDMGLYSGFALYSTIVHLPSGCSLLEIHSEPRDRLYVYINNHLVGTMARRGLEESGDLTENTTSIRICTSDKVSNARMFLVNENMGHLNYDRAMAMDQKGLLGLPTLHGDAIDGVWETFLLPMELGSVQRLLNYLPSLDTDSSVASPLNDCSYHSFYHGQFLLKVDDNKPVQDTYFSTRGWGKGIIWVNGYNLGRYWEAAGPQHALYVPRSFLKRGVNDVVVLEMDCRPKHGVLLSIEHSDFEE